MYYYLMGGGRMLKYSSNDHIKCLARKDWLCVLQWFSLL